jgi:hypothetical protein
MAVAALLMYMINRIFFDTTRAIGRGMALSDSIQSNRAVSFTLEQDATEMLGPAEDGFIILFQHRIGNDNPDDLIGAAVHDPTRKDPPPSFVGPGTWTPTSDVRCDQIMFVRRLTLGTARPLVPRDDSSFSYGDDPAIDSTQNARVWYGHVLRTASDGSNLGPTGGLGDATDAGNPNRIATNWILGRQMLFLPNTNTAPTGAHAFYPVDSSFNYHVVNDFYRLPSPLAETQPGAFALPGFADANKLFMGMCDVAWIGARDLVSTSSSDYANGPPLPTPLAVRYGLDALTGSFTGSVGEAQPFLAGTPIAPPLPSPLIGNSYLDRVYRIAFGSERLRVNPDFEAGGLESWRVAQMHGYLVPRVSDFIVEFAGDYDATAGIDVTTSNPSWPGTDNDSNGVPYTIEAGMIKWYTHEAYANNPTDGPPVDYDSTQPLTFKPIVSTAIPTGDRALRLRNDTFQNERSIYDYTPGQSEATAAFVFRHDDDGADSRWPKLLRIRYRMHDLRGELRSGNGQHGIWFEQIIRVTPP